MLAKIRMTIAAVGLALLVTGCASTTAYQAPISNFADAADKAATAFQKLDTDATAKLNAIRFDRAVADKLVKKAGCQPTLTETQCVIDLATTPPGPVYTADLMPNAVAFFNGISDYAKALDTLEKADAKKDVQTAAGNVLGSAATVATAINAAAGATVAAIKEPAAALTGYAYGLYQDNAKRVAIRRAVLIMDGIIQSGSEPITRQLQSVQEQLLADMADKVKTAQGTFLANKDGPSLKVLIEKASTMDAAIKAKLPDLYVKLAAAHGKLKEAVIDPEPDPAATLEAVSQFLQQVQNVKAIADKLSAASN